MTTRFRILTDIAGRVSEATAGNSWVTAAAVAIPLAEVDALRSKFPKAFPKWRNSTASDVEAISALLLSHCSAVGILRINKDTDEWRKCWLDKATLHSAITAQRDPYAGFISPAVVLTGLLFAQASSLAIGQVIKTGRAGGILNREGRTPVELYVTCDSDLKGDENVDIFKSTFAPLERGSRLLDIGVQPVPKEIQILTEQEEPLLMLPDYAAGIFQMRHVSLSERAKMQCLPDAESSLVAALNSRNKLALAEMDFRYSFDEIFGPVMSSAREIVGKE